MFTTLKDSLRLLRKNKILLALIFIPIVASVTLMILPLFHDFDYEFNTVLGLITFVTAIAIVISTDRHFTSRTKATAEHIIIDIPKSNLYIFQYSLCIIFLGLTASFFVVLSFMFFYENCSLTRGLRFFLLLPVTSAVIGCGLGYVNVVLFRKRAWVAIACILILSFALNVYWLKLHVPIYVYSVFWGYFPGPLYDEWIPITSAMWVHRFLVLCYAFLFVTIALIWKNRPAVSRSHITMFVLIMSVLFGIYEMRFRIGFDTRYDDLRSELGADARSEHVTLIFDRRLDNAEMEWIQALSDFYYEQITRFLDLKSERSLTIYVYKDEYQKKQLMGAGRTNFAKIINDEIHINFDDMDGVLKHEMTHVLANDFGNPIYGTTRIGFLEGLAVANEWNENYFTPHEWASALKKQRKLPDVLPLIDGSGFFQSASGMSYIVSGSFTRFLIDSFGVTLFKRAYYKENIETVYHTTPADLADRWLNFLDSVPIHDADIQLAGLLIQPSLFQKKCPHYVADVLEEANREYTNGDYIRATDLYQIALDADSENYRILIAQIRSRYYAGEIHSVLHSIDSLLTDEKLNFVSRASLKLLKGDIFLRSANADSALIEYRNVCHDYTNIPYVYVSAKLRTGFLESGLDGTLKSLVATQDSDDQENLLQEMVQKFPDNKSVKFWLTRLCFQRSDFAKVILLLKDQNVDESDSALAVEQLNMVAVSYLRLSKYRLARNSLEEAKRTAFRARDLEAIAQKLELLNWLEQRSN